MNWLKKSQIIPIEPHLQQQSIDDRWKRMQEGLHIYTSWQDAMKRWSQFQEPAIQQEIQKWKSMWAQLDETTQKAVQRLANDLK